MGPIEVEVARWSAAGQLGWWVKERREWFGRVRGPDGRHSCRSFTHQSSWADLDQVAVCTWIDGSISRRSTSLSASANTAANVGTRVPGRLPGGHARACARLRAYLGRRRREQTSVASVACIGELCRRVPNFAT